MDEAITQLQKYVSNCSWLEHIYQFCKELEDDLVNLKTMSSETIQEKLSMLDMSKEAVSCCTSVTSTNRMIWLDCSGIHQFLVPWIDAIYQQITDFVINKRGENFVTLQKRMAEISKALLQKPGRLAEFVDYVQLYRKHLKDIPQCKDDMEYTEDLYNIISRYFREQTIDEFRENRALWKQWAEFQKQMSDVNSYVSAQTPWAISESDEKFKKLEICVTLLHQKAMGGKFLDPSNPASAMVDEIKEIRLEFQGNQESLLNLNKWKKAICGESYDLSFLNGMVTEMDARFDLWKYLRSTIEHTSEWKKMLFKKMNVNQTLQKIEEWKTAAQTLKSLLPFGDNVLKFWEQHLDNFIRPLPLLEIMSSPFLKSRHWQSMFDGMGAVYDVTKDYIVEELISLKLAKHEQTIMSIYRTAVAEHDLEIRVKKMKREWEQLRFKLFKYIPDSLKNTTRSELESSNESQIKPNFRSILSIRDDYYILTGVDELKMKLMDDSIILKTMLNSTILGEMQTEVEVLATTLHQIEEITHLWITAQNKWMYLIKVFEKPSIVKEFELHTNMFEFTVHNKFKDWMRAVNADPKVMSVCPKSMSEKDHRVLQGTKLRKMLLSIIETMDTILKRLQRLLDESRMDFPRLFFLSDNEVTDLLAVSDRPEQLVPSARKCFPGIFNLALRVPKQRNKKPSRMLTANELSMNTEKLEAFAIIGEMDELLPLASEPLAPLQFNLQWFKDLEQTMKDTMVDALTDCVRFRFEDLGIIPYYKEPMSFETWINEFPVECIVVAESVVWEKQMRKCLEQKCASSLEDFKKILIQRISHLTGLLQELFNRFCSAGTKQRNFAVFTSLIGQTLNRRDLIQEILDSQSPVDNKCFEWKICLKHQMDYKPVLRAEPEIDLTPELSLKANDKEVDLTRSKTIVKTAYEMSQCRVIQLTVSTPYGYEYLGPKSGLMFVHNPLTDRAMLSLTQSLKNYQCAAITGASSVGKTDTIKEFARLYGQCLFTICCSPLLTCVHIVQYLTGLLTSGCWALFDNVNRIPTDVMYLMSQHLDHIQSVLRDLQLVQNSQYTIRGQPKFDKKTDGLDGPLIRRNSLTTLHSLEKVVTSADTVAPVQRQRTVPHGYNDKGLITFFADEWVSERSQRRNSLKEVINIRDSKMYRRKKPPPLEYEHIKPSMLQSTADFTKLKQKAEFHQEILGHINFGGRFLQACSSYGCFMTLNTAEMTHQNIPDCFRLLLRPFSLIEPDYETIARTYLYICGFHTPNKMAQKIILFLKMFQTWQPPKVQFNTSNLSCLTKILSAVRVIVENENILLQKERQDLCSLMTDEEKIVMRSIVKVLRPSLMEGEETAQFVRTLRDVFRLSMPENDMKDAVLQEGLKDHLKETFSDFSQGMLDKLIELYSCCGQTNRSTILCGPSGSGKSTMLNALVHTLNMLSYQMSGLDPEEERRKQKSHGSPRFDVKSRKRLQLLRETIANFQPPLKIVDKLGLSEKYKKSCYPRIYKSYIYPSSMSPEEFIGHYSPYGWQTGFLCQELDRISPSKTGNAFEFIDHVPKSFGYSQVWFVFDGPLHTSWCDPISGLFDASRTLVLPNGETFVLSEDTKIIMETDRLSSASPAMLSQCLVVFCNTTTFQWTTYFQAWRKDLKFKPYLTESSLEILQNLADDMVPPTLNFLQDKALLGSNVCSNLDSKYQDSVVGLHEMTAFLDLLTVLFDKYFMRPDITTANSAGKLFGMVVK
ncbi:dynein heavy chain 6, axonemal-like [Octopus sinensis]|uniref:Dynein heavy chain 6, axonemal-like n=1 Tax=Octopus sinensis TaxID=2607531 RepID=A0A7E6FS22_9MOLL|nr:dynein heavy chain 6, axonemal-like [Octopus sinensis]